MEKKAVCVQQGQLCQNKSQQLPAGQGASLLHGCLVGSLSFAQLPQEGQGALLPRTADIKASLSADLKNTERSRRRNYKGLFKYILLTLYITNFRM